MQLQLRTDLLSVEFSLLFSYMNELATQIS